MSNLAEQRIDPPSLSDLHYAIIDKMMEVEADMRATATAQDTWGDLKYDLGKLVVPAEISRACAAIGLWLNSHAGATTTELALLEDAERDLLY